MNILIKNCTLLPMTYEASSPVKYFKGSIAIAQGKIAVISKEEHAPEIMSFKEQYAENLYQIDGTGKLVMPGLINLHCHVAMTLLRGYADDISLMPWLEEKIWPFEAKMTSGDIYLGSKLGMVEMLLGGVTSFVDMYMHSDQVAEAALTTGIRTVVGATFFDSSFETFTKNLPSLVEQYHGRENGLVEVRIAPHAPYTCSPQTLKESIRLAEKYRLGMHTHLSETEAELETIYGQYQKSPIAHFEEIGFFEIPTLAAHCVHVDDKDIEILLRNEVHVSHNPESNMKLASGVAPVARMLERGVNVGLGTDGTASNNDLNLWEEMRSALFLQKVTEEDPSVLPAYQALQMMTVYGAKALGKENQLGVLKEGAEADLILIDLKQPHLIPVHNIIDNLVYCGKASDVESVIVQGKLVVENREVKTADLDLLYDQVQHRADSIRKSLA